MNLYRFVNYDRSGRIAWLLQEMGLPFECKTMPFGPDGNFSEDYLNKSPVGKVPALELEAEILFETGSILLRLCELYPQHDLFPTPNSEQRGSYLNWFFLMTASFDSICFEFVRPDIRDPDERAVRIARSKADVPRFLRALDKQLADNPFIMGDKFSIVDIQATGPLLYCMAQGMLSEWPKLESYAVRMSQRPAAVKSAAFKLAGKN